MKAKKADFRRNIGIEKYYFFLLITYILPDRKESPTLSYRFTIVNEETPLDTLPFHTSRPKLKTSERPHTAFSARKSPSPRKTAYNC